MIHYDIDVALFGVAEARKNLIAKDPQAQFALGSSPSRKLTELAQIDAGPRQAGRPAVGHSALYLGL